MTHTVLEAEPSAMTRGFAGRTLFLVRHGESTWNKLALAQGHNDEAELTAQGHEQADAIASVLSDYPVGSIYVSDLRRAVQTATPLSSMLGLPLRTDVRLRERSLGSLEGALLVQVGPEVTGIVAAIGGQQSVTDPDIKPEGGESIRDLYLRAAGFSTELAAKVAAGSVPPGDIVIVAHGGMVRVLHACLSGVPVEHMNWIPVPNGTVLRVSARREHP